MCATAHLRRTDVWEVAVAHKVRSYTKISVERSQTTPGIGDDVVTHVTGLD